MAKTIIIENLSHRSVVGSHYHGLSYAHGMSRLLNGVEGGEVAIISYAPDICASTVSSLDIECTFDDIFDELGYAYETVYSDDSMLVWFGVQTRNPQAMIDEVMRKIRECEHLAGLNVSFGEQTFTV